MNNTLSKDELARLQEVLTEELGVEPDQLVPEAHLTNDLGADSLTRVEITMRIEELFNIVVPDDRVEQVETVGDIYELVSEELNKPARVPPK